jgi:hypothetical protein
MNISTQPPPATQWPDQPKLHPFGEKPCWADVLTRAERAELARFLAAWCTAFYGSASTPQIRRRNRRMKQGAALEVSRSMTRASAEMADLRIDVTERARVAAA